MAWLDVNDQDLFAVSDAIARGDEARPARARAETSRAPLSRGDDAEASPAPPPRSLSLPLALAKVLLASTEPNGYHLMFRSLPWVLFFRVVLPAAAGLTVVYAARNLRAMGGLRELLRALAAAEDPNLLPFLVLVVEGVCMLSVALAAGVFGLYWSGDLGGKWAADMHASMLAGGGFFTSVLMAVHLSKMRKEHLHRVRSADDGRDEPRGAGEPPPPPERRRTR